MKLVFIGSTCADISIMVDHLPSLEEDVNAYQQEMHLGGCAHNAAHAAGLFHVPFTLASPVGTGIYGTFVEEKLKEEKLPVWIHAEEENGACYCIVDKQGNRSFLSVQGAEYHFQREWLQQLKTDEDTWIYVCGLEMENQTGENIISYLEEAPGKVCFAPGPRIMKIAPAKMDRILKRADLIHLNTREICSYTGCDDVKAACAVMHAVHGASVIVTDGENDVAVMDDMVTTIPAVSCQVIDSTGAGDSHIGSVLACLCCGMNLYDAVKMANQISSIVCQKIGACIDVKDIPADVIDLMSSIGELI